MIPASLPQIQIDNPELIIDSDKETLDESVTKIYSFLERKAIIN